MPEAVKTEAPLNRADNPFSGDEGDGSEARLFAEKTVVLPAPEGEPKAPTAAPVAAPDASEAAAAELRRQISIERDARQRAEQAAQGERDRATQAERSATATGTALIDTNIEFATRVSAQAQADLEAALTAGNYKAAAAAQVAISKAEANLLRLQEQKQYFDTQRPAVSRETSRAPPPPPQVGDNAQSISAELDRTGFPKSAAWIRAHPDMVADQRAINKVDGAHGYVVNTLGFVPDTEAYFAKLEELLGMRQQSDGMRQPANDVRQSEPAPRQNAAPSAPVTPSAPNFSGQTSRRSIRLSPEQREHAHDVLGMTDEEYAAAIAAAETDDRYHAGRGRR